jgi:uncharacterized damage-inducible protein DinB
MNKEVQSIIRNLQNTLNGEPWFGRPVYTILEEVDISKVYINPGNSGHSLIELLYHMITWAGFTLGKLDKNADADLTQSEDQDWREINSSIHSWTAGLEKFRKIHEKIISILETKEDDFLSGMVESREFNYRFMLNGLIQHNIYHLGQVAYVKKLLN